MKKTEHQKTQRTQKAKQMQKTDLPVEGVEEEECEPESKRG
jgi:hypothetical protein